MSERPPEERPTDLRLGGWLLWWHGIQTVAFLGLIVSGACMHWADSPWAPLSFGDAVTAHNVLGLAYLVSWVVFVVLNLRSGNLRHYRLRDPDLRSRLWPQFRYYAWGIFHREPEPFPPRTDEKFNPAQQLAYAAVMYLLMPILLASGTLLFFPILAPEHALGLPGLLPMAIIHLSAGYLLAAFLILHVYLTLFLHRS
ncbi:MAG: cytochrome b [bacterium]|nr:cytochrome b [bacterium]